MLVNDLEQHRDNPALHKHHKLARSLLSAGFAKELKPDAEERRRLETLVAYPPTTKLREEDEALMWKFRYSLTKEKRALTKLLKCVDQRHAPFGQYRAPTGRRGVLPIGARGQGKGRIGLGRCCKGRDDGAQIGLCQPKRLTQAQH